jgi:hypothetical protein
MSVKAKQLLVDTMTFRPTGPVLEATSGPGKYIARGEFARSDRATENKRLYPRGLWERELDRMSKQLEGRKVYGELDHPMDGRTQLKRASHIVTDLHLEGEIVIGTAHILDTDHGKNLKAILDAGGAVGVSSRGFGTTKPNLKGEDVVQNDYRLMTFDFVAEPAMASAYPKVELEHTNTPSASYLEHESVTEAAMDPKTFKELKEKFPELAEGLWDDAEREYEIKAAAIWAKKIMAAREEATTELRAEFAEKLETVVTQAKEGMEESVRERLLADPAVAGAKKVLSEVRTLLRPFIIPEDVEAVVREQEGKTEALEQKLAESKLENANLAAENDKLASIAKEAGYRFHLEQTLHGVEHAELVRELLGDVKRYESVKEMDTRLASILEEVNKQQTEQDEHKSEVERLKEDLARSQLISEKAIEASKELAAQVYLEQRLANHPDAERARDLVENRNPSTKAEVDQLLERSWSRPSVTEDLDIARQRVRGILNSPTQEYLQEQEEGRPNGQNGATQNYNGLGMNAADIRALSGLPENPNSN